MDKIDMAGPSITQHEIDTVIDAVTNGWYENMYYYVETFEKEFARYHNRKFAVMTPNCTTSLHLLLTVLGVSEGDEVIVPECTWIASIAPAISLNATPVFCDIDPVNWCLCPESLEKNITEKTKAIIVVDLYGNMPLMDDIVEIANKYNVPLIEDAAEALGSVYKGIRAGKFGVGSVFSFHRTKTLTTGEGGMLLLDDEELYKKCMIWRDHGRDYALPPHMRNPNTKIYFNEEVTYKYMPFNLQAALGYAQFQRIDELIEIKRHHLKFYREQLGDIDGVKFNPEPEGGINGTWITTMVWDKSYGLDKEKFIDELEKLGITVRPFFYPLSMLPPFDIKENVKKNKISYDISNRGINLPGAMNLTDEQLMFVCNKIKKVLK